MPNVSVKVEGLSTLADIPGWIDDGQRKFVEQVGHKLAEAVQAASPKSAIPFHATGATFTEVRIVSEHPGAHALNKGAFIKGKGKKLKFTVGGKLVFVKYVKLPARKYATKALRKRNAIVDAEYQRIFSTLDGHL